jgi:hypothetical protein
MKLKYILSLLLIVLAFDFLVGCDDSVDSSQQIKQEEVLSEANRQIGLPNITNFQELKNVKRIYELRDRSNLITYTYLVDLNGHLHFLTKSLGYGLPYSTQFSNPEKVTYRKGSTVTLPQAEPNGLYMPSTAEGTWITAITNVGEPQIIYVEPRVIVSPIQLKSQD